MKTLQVNQKIHSILYGGRDGYIKEIIGKQSPDTIKELGGMIVMGGSAEIRVRFLNGSESVVPESIIHGVQWKIGELLNEDEIKAMDEEFEYCKQSKEDAADAKKRQDAKELAELPAMFPYLELAKGKVGAMQNIRTSLKKFFPGIKFSVTNPHRSTCEIRWIDGPTIKEVDNVVNKFEDHKPDMSGDFSDYNPSNFNHVFGGMQYVFTTRTISYETKQQLGVFADALYLELRPDGGEVYGCHNGDDIASELMRETSLSAGSKITGIEETEMRSGLNSVNVFHRVIVSTPVLSAEVTKPFIGASDGIVVRHNEEKDGIEIVFPGKPDESVRQALKDNRFRWSNFQKLWYAKRSDRTLAFAESLLA